MRSASKNVSPVSAGKVLLGGTPGVDLVDEGDQLLRESRRRRSAVIDTSPSVAGSVPAISLAVRQAVTISVGRTITNVS
jgi:hypothetical protein